MRNNPYLYIFFWGLKIAGLLQIVVFTLDMVKFLIFNKQIYLERDLIILVMGMVLFIVGRKYSKKFS